MKINKQREQRIDFIYRADRMPVKGLVERLRDGENVVVAEGYLFEFERRGYLQAGGYVPEVVLEHPELVKQLHEEFVHAGSDVVLAFTYYGHRHKLKVVNREADLERLNVTALRIARQVADETGTLMAGNICNTTAYERGNKESEEATEAMFKEQIEWAVQGGADYIVGETFFELGEAMLALKSIQKYGNGLPAVISFHSPGSTTLDKVPYPEACRQLEEAGAAAVGLNCGRGPKTMLPLLREIRQACKGPIAALPVPYRTTPKSLTFCTLQDEETGKLAFPDDLPAHLCSRSQITEFATDAKEIGVQYIGLCCGSSSHYLRIVAEIYGRNPPASKYSADMSKHFIYTDRKGPFKECYTRDLRNHLLSGSN